ncbi:hypothetical protein LPJ73_000406 [Coemansia sp. RSA 2703]|nr:hypothetical protein LPJ73_000406 [Coemansia sp. RSA 2703]KAJ2377594.1 hypothetical protein IW150_001297 [Coemansia sp. RSA 2607]KAJ2398163.1 hypothetical protein GGI05_000250 [Coemansia sp. RSA 2603]
MDHLTFSVRDENGAWQRIADDFCARLPLRNLIWRGGATQAPRFIEQLNIRVTVAVTDADDDAEDPAATAGSSSEPPPLLHLLVADSDVDADTYKSVVRPRVKTWVDRVAQRRGAGWLILYVPGAAEAQRIAAAKTATGPAFLAKRTTTFDRLRSDFQPKRGDARVVLLQPSQVESWNAVLLAVRDAAVAALEDRAAALGEAIRRMDANRLLPGWNYCAFFVLKERLIALHRLMGLRGEALAQYDELEAVFFQLLDAQRLAWFGAFGGRERGDDFADLLATHRKPYAARMAANEITLFDFRMYLFGRQCQLLAADARYDELATRAQRFVPALAAAMRAPGTALPPAFIAAWTYSVCHNVVEICEGAAPGRGPWTGAARDAGAALAASKADFLAAARRELDVLAAFQGDAEAQACVSNPVLAEALAAPARFDQVYVRTCEQAAQYYAECGRRRLARQQHADVARLHESRDRWEDAARVLRTLEPPSGAPLCAVVDVPLLTRLARCEQKAGRPAECLRLALRLLAASPSASCAQDAETMLASQALALQDEHSFDATALLVLSDVQGDKDAGGLRVRVRSRLIGALDDALVSVVVAGRSDGGRQAELRFTARAASLPSGDCDLVLANAFVSCAGRFVVKRATVRVGNAVLSAACAPKDVTLRVHPHRLLASVVGAAPVADAGCAALRLRVETKTCGAASGLRVRLFDAATGHALVGANTVVSHPRTLNAPEPSEPQAPRITVDAAADALLFTDPLACDTTHEIDVQLLPAHASCADIVVCAEYCAAADCSDDEKEALRLSIWRGLVDLAPPLRLAARLLAQHPGGPMHVQVRAQCVVGCVRLASLGVFVGDTRVQADCTWRGVLRPGECVARVLRLPALDDATDAGRPAMQAAAVYSVLADTGGNEDVSERTMLVAVDATAASSADAAATPVAYTVSAGLASGRFCHVFELVRLTVRLSLTDRTAVEQRVCVALSAQPHEWLVSGATHSSVLVAASSQCTLEFTLVPLTVGLVALPQVLCDGALVVVARDHAAVCVLPNDAVPTVFTVPVLVPESPSASAIF